MIGKQPQFTVHVNVVSLESSEWIGRCWEFFDTEADAKQCFERHQAAGNCPSLRPYHPNDRDHLGAVHGMRTGSPDNQKP